MKFNIIGFQKNSFIDYPASISSVVFTPGCNMNCWYCHNMDIISATEGIIEVDDVLDFLKERAGFIDAVVVSGGEPTMQVDLPLFLKAAKETGVKTKLDTNGTNLKMLQIIVEQNLVDYIAMDVKAPFDKYGKITCVKDIEEIKACVEFIKTCGVEYEFRTTFAPNQNEDEIIQLLKEISQSGTVENYSLQAYTTPAHIEKDKLPHHEEQVFHKIKELALASNWVKNFVIKNF